jgi:hypothetical protein
MGRVGEILAQRVFAACMGEREESWAREQIKGFSQADRGAFRRIVGCGPHGLHRWAQCFHAKRLPSGGDRHFFPSVGRREVFHAATQAADFTLSALGDGVGAVGGYQACGQT